jgi:hypothetical protein
MDATSAPIGHDAGPWSDLEQAFFASAPPDNPEPPPAPESFDDLE